MPSQFFGLNIAASGLRAANAAMLTTANNISNTTTDGYSRQKVTQEASDALRVFTKYGCAGAGVDTISIDRVRDVFYDEKYRKNATNLGKYESLDYYNNMIERYFQDDSGSGFASLFTKMQVDLQSLLTNKTDSAKTNYVGSVKSLAEYFNNTSSNLQELQATVNDEIKLACETINYCATEIMTLNNQINTIEMTGANANELRDKRDVLVDKISKLVSVETKETKVIDDNDPTRDTGATKFEVRIAGGQLLVDDISCRQLLCVGREPDDKVDQNDIDGLYDIMWVNSNYKEGVSGYLGTFSLHNKLIGGNLQGLIEMRDGNNGQIFKGKAEGTFVDNGDNSFTFTINNKDANGNVVPLSSYMLDMNKCNLPEKGTIHIGARDYQYTDWKFNDDETYEFTIKLPDDAKTIDVDYIKNDLNNGMTDIRIGDAVDYQGIPYYNQQVNEWIRAYASEANKIMESGYTADSKKGELLYTGTRFGDSKSQYTYADLTGSNRGYYYLTAGNFAVNNVIVDDPTRLATKSDATEGNEQMGTAQALYDMANSATIFRGAKAGEFLSKLQADIALNKNNSKTMLATCKSLNLTIDNQRLSVSGVDKDEEALSLVQYQNAYTLSSKMVQTLTEIYDRLILQTGV